MAVLLPAPMQRAPVAVQAALLATVTLSAAAVAQATVEQLGRRLTARSQMVHDRAMLVSVLTVAGILLPISVCVAFIASFNWSVSGLNWFAGELAKGNLTVFLRNEARDELSEAGRLLGDARDRGAGRRGRRCGKRRRRPRAGELQHRQRARWHHGDRRAD